MVIDDITTQIGQALNMGKAGRVAKRIGIAVLAAAAIYFIAPPVYENTLTGKGYHNTLDPQAFRQQENPFKYDREGILRAVYKDTDKDGDLDNVVIYTNSDLTKTEIPFRKGLEGEVLFPTLSEHAITPLHRPDQLNIDYKDVNGDEKIESITRINDPFGAVQTNVVQWVNDRYVFTPDTNLLEVNK